MRSKRDLLGLLDREVSGALSRPSRLNLPHPFSANIVYFDTALYKMDGVEWRNVSDQMRDHFARSQKIFDHGMAPLWASSSVDLRFAENVIVDGEAFHSRRVFAEIVIPEKYRLKYADLIDEKSYVLEAVPNECGLLFIGSQYMWAECFLLNHPPATDGFGRRDIPVRKHEKL